MPAGQQVNSGLEEAIACLSLYALGRTLFNLQRRPLPPPKLPVDEPAIDRVSAAYFNSQSESERRHIIDLLHERQAFLEAARVKALADAASLRQQIRGCKEYLAQVPRGGDPEIERILARLRAKDSRRRRSMAFALALLMAWLVAMGYAWWLVDGARRASEQADLRKVAAAESQINGVLLWSTLGAARGLGWSAEMPGLREHAQTHQNALAKTSLVESLQYARSALPRGLCATFAELERGWSRATNAEAEGRYADAVGAAESMLNRSKAAFADVSAKIHGWKGYRGLLDTLTASLATNNWRGVEENLEGIRSISAPNRLAPEASQAQSRLDMYLGARGVLAGKDYKQMSSVPESLKDDLDTAAQLAFETATNRMLQAAALFSQCQDSASQQQVTLRLSELSKDQVERLLRQAIDSLRTGDVERARKIARDIQTLMTNSSDSELRRRVASLEQRINLYNLCQQAGNLIRRNGLPEAEKLIAEARRLQGDDADPESAKQLARAQQELDFCRLIERAEDALRNNKIGEAETSLKAARPVAKDLGGELQQRLADVQRYADCSYLAQQAQQALKTNAIDEARNLFAEAQRRCGDNSGPEVPAQLKLVEEHLTRRELLRDAQKKLRQGDAVGAHEALRHAQGAVPESLQAELQQQFATVQREIDLHAHLARATEALKRNDATQADTALEEAQALLSSDVHPEWQQRLQAVHKGSRLCRMLDQVDLALKQDRLSQAEDYLHDAQKLVAGSLPEMQERLVMAQEEVRFRSRMKTVNDALKAGDVQKARTAAVEAKGASGATVGLDRKRAVMAAEKSIEDFTNRQLLVAEIENALRTKSFSTLGSKLADYQNKFLGGDYPHASYTNALLALRKYQEHQRERNEAQAVLAAVQPDLAATHLYSAIDALKAIPMLDFTTEIKALGQDAAAYQAQYVQQQKKLFKIRVEELRGDVKRANFAQAIRDCEGKIEGLEADFSKVLDADRGSRQEVSDLKDEVEKKRKRINANPPKARPPPS